MSWFYHILDALSLMLVEPTLPKAAHPDWQIVQSWHADGEALSFKAVSATLGERCAQEPNNVLSLPVVLQGFHNVYADERLIYSTMNRTPDYGSELYNRADISCNQLAHARQITWQVIDTTHSYAKIFEWPVLQTNLPIDALLTPTFLIAAAGSLVVLGVVTQIIFAQVLGWGLTLPLLGACLSFATFFVLACPSSFNIAIPTFYLHRIRDVFTWIGTAFMWTMYTQVCSVPLILSRLQIASVITGVTIIALARNLDHSQVGSSVCLLGNLLLCVSSLAIISYRLMRKGNRKRQVIQFFGAAIPCVCGINEILATSGLVPAFPFFSIGSVFLILILALSANEQAVAIYQERDHLRKNLESEVQEKTKSLTMKSSDLELALSKLKGAQAELVQSAKLASLGTLSAGIAHEINNSLNYPTGAVKVLKRLLNKQPFEEQDKKRADEIVSTMSEGLQLTAEIIKNLKTYAGGNTTTKEMLNLAKTTEGILVLLKSKIGDDLKVRVEIPQDAEVCFSKTAFAQILLNLLGNAVDAVRERHKDLKDGLISVTWVGDAKTGAKLSVEDNGSGIPPQVIERIFDPFFTTKTEGKGTGLGLHIVHNEMRKADGAIKVQSTPGQGTQFLLEFAKENTQGGHAA